MDEEYWVSFYGLGEVRVVARNEEVAIGKAIAKMDIIWSKRIEAGEMEPVTEEDVCAVETK